ncbi:MAG: hypothetical protein JNK17_02170 [Hydrogenophaga sp.]|nr:hypothetical protein [Hydrogenophaga sp.]
MADKGEEVRLQAETIRYLQVQMREAVREGIKEAMTEEAAEAFWGAGLAMLQKQAQQHAGRFVLGGLMGLAKKAGLFVMFGGIVYAVGGWTALAGLFKSIFSSPSP